MPDHRRIHGVIFAALAVTVLINPVCGAVVTQDVVIDDEMTMSINYASTGISHFYMNLAIRGIVIPAIQDFGEPSALILFASFECSDKTKYSYDIPVTYKHNGNVVGAGRLGYYRDVDGKSASYIYTTFDSWDKNYFTGKSGRYYIDLVYEGDFNGVNTRDRAGEADEVGVISFSNGNGASGYCPYSGSWTYTYNSVNEFKNQISISQDGPSVTINVIRRISGGIYNSRVIISGNQKTNPYLDTTKDVNETVTVPYIERPYYIQVYSPVLGRWYNQTVLSDPGGLTTTIYVRDSQTGALIPGATVSILDGLTGTTTNETFTSGSGTISLEKTSTLRYLATATASGYTSLGSIQFGTMDDTLDIVLWMAPDAPPDVPTEPEKSMLYGYIQTQGSQQPISGATVSLDNHGSTTTSSTGFYLFNNVTPGPYTITASAPLHDALSEPVTVDPAATPHNLALKGHFLLTVSAKDADDLTTLHNTTISLSDGQESTQNPATFNVDYGPYTITAAAGGYYPQTQSAYLDKPGTTTATVLLTARPEPVPPPEMPNYPPHNVRFMVRSAFGAPIEGVTVEATGYETTMGALSWLFDLLGINYEKTQVYNQTMRGTTGSDGSIDFMMFEAIKYRITFTKPGEIDTVWEGFPKDEYYTIWAPRFGTSEWFEHGVNPLEAVNFTVTGTTATEDAATISVYYNDTLAKTTVSAVYLNQTFTNGTEILVSQYLGGTASTWNHTFTLEGDHRGESYLVHLRAQHETLGNITRDFGVYFKPAPISFGLPEDLLLYGAMAVMIFTALFFGQSSVGAGCIVFAFEGWLFYWIGWLQDLGSEYAVGTALIIISVVAVLVNVMQRSKRERYA